jgi:hypothetical protein
MNLCTVCGLDFGSVKAFDRHRVGVHDYLFSEGVRMDPPRFDGRRCLSESEMESLVSERTGCLVFSRNARGVWSMGEHVRGARERTRQLVGHSERRG